VKQSAARETIYRSLFIQTRGVLKKELLAHLRATRSIRRSRHATLKRRGLGKFNDAISIRDRPSEVEDRAVPGHWEGDLIAGSDNSFIATLVERQTRYVMLAKVGNKDSHSVIQALIKQARKLPKELYRSLTWDRGTEMAGHKKFTLATDIDVFLCEPHSPLSADCYAIACPAMRGNAAQTKIPTVCCDSTFQKARICRYIVKPS
jgi:IS30 family transposase